MTEAQATYLELFKLAAASELVQEATKVAAVPGLLKALGLLGLGGVGVGVPSYLVGKRMGTADAESDLLKNRNLAFGAGLTAGIAAPSVVKALGKATGLGLTGDQSDYNGEFTSI